MTSVYEAAGGADGILALAHAWHERCLADPVAAHPFSHGVHVQHMKRLAAYWGEALGGPAAYSASMGDETGVQRLHAGNGEHTDLDERAVACFDAALGDVGLVDHSHGRASRHPRHGARRHPAAALELDGSGQLLTRKPFSG